MYTIQEYHCVMKESGTMWWISAIANALGIVAGFAQQSKFTYVMFGISFCAFSHNYAKLTWRLIYDWMVSKSEVEIYGDTVLMNEVVCAWGLFLFYILMVVKLGMSCILICMFQCVMMWIVNKVFAKQPPKPSFLICYLAELAAVFAIVT